MTDRKPLRFGGVQNLYPAVGVLALLGGTGVATVAIGMIGSPYAAIMGLAVALLGVVALMVRRGTVVDALAQRVVKQHGWRFRPLDDEIPFSAFVEVRLARTGTSTPVLAVQLVGEQRIYLPIPSRGRKKDAVSRGREVAALMALPFAPEFDVVTPLEMG